MYKELFIAYITTVVITLWHYRQKNIRDAIEDKVVMFVAIPVIGVVVYWINFAVTKEPLSFEEDNFGRNR